MDLRRRLRRRSKPRVEGLLEALQAELELGVPRRELARRPLLQRSELATEQARQEDRTRGERREQDEKDG